MSLDLTLEEQEVLDHVRGGIVEPPSNASVAAKNKWTKGEVKARKIIRDSIDKCLAAYVSELNTSKEMMQIKSCFLEIILRKLRRAKMRVCKHIS